MRPAGFEPATRGLEVREPTTRFRFGLFVVAELLCTGALVVWVFSYR